MYLCREERATARTRTSKNSFDVEGVSQRGVEQAETSVGRAECKVWRRGVEEADRHAADVEVTREGDKLPDTGLSQDEATEEGRFQRNQGTGRTSRTGVGVTFVQRREDVASHTGRNRSRQGVR